MPLDHSETYKLTKLRHLPHVARLWTIRKAVKKYGVERGSLADFGCSNGYITEIIRKDLRANPARGFDHSENIEIAKTRYPDITFQYVDLNKVEGVLPKFDTVTCFETVEHVGKPEAAVQHLLNSKSEHGVVIISVPIEIGLVGILKYAAKRILYRYPLELDVGDRQYLLSLLTGDRISKYRTEADGFSTHFGFDYRVIDDILRDLGCDDYLTWRSFTSQFFVIGASSLRL